MYSIESCSFGIKMVMGGIMTPDEMNLWLTEFKDHIEKFEDGFCVQVDMRTLVLFAPNAQPILKQGQQLAREMGMKRSIVIVTDSVTALQLQRIAKQTGIYKWERYIDADVHQDWPEIAENWLVNEVDPDNKKSTAIGSNCD